MPTRFVAHRGGAALWPENSLLAFRNALAAGAGMLELDVHLTRDGEVAVIHDPTLDRTSTGTGALRDCTVADLRAVRLRARDGTVTDEHVPTLGEVLVIAAPTAAVLLVEFKGPGRAVRYERDGERVRAVPGERYEGLEAKVVEALREAGVAGRAMLMAFNPAVLAEVRRLVPEQPTALLVDRQHVAEPGAANADTVAWAQQAGATFLGMHWTLCDESVVAAARRAAVMVGVFTVNDELTMRRLAALGVDVIITDRPDLVPKDLA
ncbi:MAG: hypothetical protein HY294_05330 [Candidatus Rokubacteria bacterium]|nr:hypothetical protein [Candidatus Rokubacteria bacterium]MBI3825400.1 hypothetical protein [Candidatus Rokubacteria bacterium]